MTDPLAEIRVAVEEAAATLLGDGVARTVPGLERPPKPELGDYSTNAALLLAPSLGSSPREIAGRMREALGERLGESAQRVEVAGPGFLNVFLSDRWHREATAAVLAAGDRFGGGTAPEPARVLVEFVSANPTGPLTAAGGRHGAFGDALARILAFAGHTVEREYLLNDIGGQVEQFARSIAARMRGTEPPDDGYSGEYVADLAEQLAAAGVSPHEPETIARRGTEAMREAIEATLERYRVSFDTWTSQRTLEEAGKVSETIELLRRGDHVYESEGATWLRTTAFGDDKDRVLIRADGQPTYFAADIAYHRDKLERGAEWLIDVWGADHHGYTTRMRAALAWLDADPDRFEALIMQFVHLVEGDGRAQMSKRKGEFVTLDELLDDIGVDAARFFMLQRSHDTTIDLDLDLARRESQDNPVYYVQYAHARIASILRKAIDEGATSGGPEAIGDAAGDPPVVAAPAEPAERALVQRLLELPDEVRASAERRTPHRLCAYATATAADFHAFYRDCRVVGAEPGVQEARLALCLATKNAVSTTLSLLGVSAPERM